VWCRKKPHDRARGNGPLSDYLGRTHCRTAGEMTRRRFRARRPHGRRESFSGGQQADPGAGRKCGVLGPPRTVFARPRPGMRTVVHGARKRPCALFFFWMDWATRAQASRGRFSWMKTPKDLPTSRAPARGGTPRAKSSKQVGSDRQVPQPPECGRRSLARRAGEENSRHERRDLGAIGHRERRSCAQDEAGPAGLIGGVHPLPPRAGPAPTRRRARRAGMGEGKARLFFF